MLAFVCCSCEFGDNVLVYYEKNLENFIVFTLTGNLHYIHSDSLKECDFSKGTCPFVGCLACP